MHRLEKIDRRRDNMNDNHAYDDVHDHQNPNIDFENLQQHRYHNWDQQVALNELGTADQCTVINNPGPCMWTILHEMANYASYHTVCNTVPFNVEL